MPIRSATVVDIPAMMTLERDAATAAHWSREQYQAAISGQGPPRVALIIEEGTQLQGFMVARRVEFEWEIENIIVAAPARRRGLGAQLIERFLDLAQSRHAKSVFLEVRESNLPARSFYEKWAFLESGRRKRYYRDPEEDAIGYRLELN